MIIAFIILITFFKGCTEPADTNIPERIYSTDESKKTNDGSKTDPVEEDCEDNQIGTVRNTREGEVLFNQDDIIITLESINLDKMYLPFVQLNIENISDKRILVEIEDVSINGVMVTNDPKFACEVTPSDIMEDSIMFSEQELEYAEISTVQEIEFSFRITDVETSETIAKSDSIMLEVAENP